MNKKKYIIENKENGKKYYCYERCEESAWFTICKKLKLRMDWDGIVKFNKTFDIFLG